MTFEITDIFGAAGEAVEGAKELVTGDIKEEVEEKDKQTKINNAETIKLLKDQLSGADSELEEAKTTGGALETIKDNTIEAGKELGKGIVKGVKGVGELGAEVGKGVVTGLKKEAEVLMDGAEFVEMYLMDKFEGSKEAVAEYLADVPEEDKNILQQALKMTVPLAAAKAMFGKAKELLKSAAQK